MKIQRLPTPSPVADETDFNAAMERELKRAAMRDSPRNDISDNVPSYVTHDPEVTRVGRLTAEAVAVDYEAAAKAIDEMGKQLTKLQAEVEAETKKIEEAILETMALAERYRDEGLQAFKRIEAAAKLTQAVRDQCAAMQAQLEQRDK